MPPRTPAAPELESNAPTQSVTDDKLDQVIELLSRLDKRDKHRMMGSHIKSIISIAYFAVIIWGSWYFISHGKEIMQSIIEETAKQTMQMGQSGMDKLLENVGGSFQVK